MNRIKEIFLQSDISLASMMLGLGMIFWGLFAVVMAPGDFFTFADSMKFAGTWFWFCNYVLSGSGFIYVALRRFPAMPSMLIGTHACLVWTWIAAIRGFSNVTSGVTLNFIVITMGLLLVQRSGTQK